MGRVAKFTDGRVSENDPVWQGLYTSPITAQGFLYGSVQKNGKIGGLNVAYIYPMSSVAILGHFQDNYMKSAQPTHVENVTCSNNILRLSFDKPRGPPLWYDLSTNSSYGDLPLVQDHYESETVQVGLSTIPNTGDGIFAMRDLKPHEIVSFYNGFRYRNIWCLM